MDPVLSDWLAYEPVKKTDNKEVEQPLVDLSIAEAAIPLKRPNSQGKNCCLLHIHYNIMQFFIITIVCNSLS